MRYFPNPYQDYQLGSPFQIDSQLWLTKAQEVAKLIFNYKQHAEGNIFREINFTKMFYKIKDFFFVKLQVIWMEDYMLDLLELLMLYGNFQHFWNLRQWIQNLFLNMPNI